jgi:predicted AAA+ superfamily ATPase
LGSVTRQTGGKYIYTQTGPMINIAQAKDALNILEMAGLIYKVYHSPGHGLPPGAHANMKIFKVLLHDTGIFQQIAGLRLSDTIIANHIDMMNKGNLAETFVGVEMLKYGNPFKKSGLCYWHREKRGSSAEVDFLIASKGEVLPVEIKSGSTGKMQSMRIFQNENISSWGIRISRENLSQNDKISVIPLYAVSNLFAEI